MAFSRCFCVMSLATTALGSLRGAIKYDNRSLAASISCDCGTNPVCCALEEVRKNGVLVKMLGIGSDLNSAMDANGGMLDWKGNIGKFSAINDCEGGHIEHCSGWALLKQGLVPMVYNYPDNYDNGQPVAPKQHMVGIMVGSAPEVEGKITRMHVVDGDTWSRYSGGLHPEDTLAINLATSCPNWKEQDVNKIPFVCVPKEPHTKEWCNTATGRIEAPIGVQGSYWSDHFMYTDFPEDKNPYLSKEGTMERQCEFQQDSDGKLDWQLYLGALDSFYQKAMYQQSNGQVKPLPDASLYLENELNMETPVDELMPILHKGMLAVVVQTNTCAEQLGSVGAAEAKQKCADYYTRIPLPTNGDFPDPESYMIDESKRAACRLADQLTKETGKWVPAIEAHFATNSVVDVEKWKGYLGEQSDPKNYLSWLDCCGENYLAC